MDGFSLLKLAVGSTEFYLGRPIDQMIFNEIEVIGIGVKDFFDFFPRFRIQMGIGDRTSAYLLAVD
jgi:hypothetical protein